MLSCKRNVNPQEFGRVTCESRSRRRCQNLVSRECVSDGLFVRFTASASESSRNGMAHHVSIGFMFVDCPVDFPSGSGGRRMGIFRANAANSPDSRTGSPIFQSPQLPQDSPEPGSMVYRFRVQQGTGVRCGCLRKSNSQTPVFFEDMCGSGIAVVWVDRIFLPASSILDMDA